MLIITVENNAARITFRLDGRLAGGGVRELARSWSAVVVKQPRRQVSFDLAGLTSVDVVGKQFLAHVLRRGDGVMGSAVDTDVADEISSTSSADEPGSVSIIPVTGELRAPVDSGLMQRVQAELRGGARKVRLDLSDLTGLDAAGVGELIGVLNATRAAGGSLDVVNARPRLRRMLEAAGVLQLLRG